MGNDWDEIKRLAADFQKAQLTSTLQKLSERNCVEIVALLLEKQLLDVVFTNDGKEYITPDHLEREIQDELYANGGRVNLVEVSKTLNVDLSRIETLAERIAENAQVHFMLGQLIDEDYITHIAQEINEKLAQRGEISISDLTSQFDLPSDFLQRDVVEKHLGKLIKGRQDATNPRVFFTQAYIQRCKAKIRGALSAITRPTNIAVILQQINVQEKIFHSLLDEISPAGQVTSKLANAQYVPHIYAKTQADWVNSFYKQNSFLEYDAINKLGITDAKQYIRKQFPNEEFLFLKRVALGARLIELTVVTALNECSATKHYLDLSTILPSNLSEEDIEEVFSAIMAQKHSNPSSFVYLNSIVFSQPYLTQLVEPCQELAQAQAKAAIDNGVYQQFIVEKTLAQKGGSNASAQDYDDDSRLDKRDERRKKAASGKAGGGAQGRETKTKSTKKHQRGRGAANNDSDDEDDAQQQSRAGGGSRKTVKPLELVKASDIVKLITPTLEEEGLDHLSKSIAALFLNQLNQASLAKAQELYEATPQTNRRQTHASIQERVNTLLVDIRLYEKGLKLLPHDSQTQLVKYLLKSLGNDLCNELAIYVANECNLTVKSSTLNVDQRNKLAQDCDAEYRNALIEQNKALNKTIDDFELSTESVLKACSMIIKKVDKKKDRQLIVQHKEKLQQQLQECNEPALVLHLAALILFTTISGCILHASGKFVGVILQHIRSSLNDPQNELLLRYHDLVLQVLQAAPDSSESKAALEQLQSLRTDVVDLALHFARASISKAD